MPVAPLDSVPPAELTAPFSVRVVVPIDSVPLLSVSAPFTVSLVLSVRPAALLSVRSLTVVGRPLPGTWAAVPLYA